MDEMKSPEEILDEIMNRSPAPAPEPDPSPSPSRFDPPEDIPPPPPDAPGKTNPPSGAAKAVPWLCAALAVSLVLLGVCLFRMVETNGRLFELETAAAETAEALAEVDRLRQENTALEQTRERQQSRIEEMQAQLRENTSSQNLWRVQYADEYTKRKQLDYLWYLTQFMEHEDYPMAALIFAYWAEDYWSNLKVVDAPKNVIQVRQYETYRQQLIGQGYLEPSHFVGGQATLTEKWDTSTNPDMAALGILWCALNAHYVDNNPNLAAQLLVEYQTFALDNHGGSYPEYLRNAASDYTIELYEQLLYELIELENLIEADGLLKSGPASQEYPEMPFVPFNLPVFYGYTIPEGTTRTD